MSKILGDADIKQVVYEAWHKEPRRPPKVELQIIDDGPFAVDANMFMYAPRKINLTWGSYGVAICHEFRHLTRSPIFWQTWAEWAAVLAKENYPAEEIRVILNVFADLQVDHSLFKDYPDEWDMCFQELLQVYWMEKSPLLYLYLRAHESFMQTDHVETPLTLSVKGVEVSAVTLECDAHSLSFSCISDCDSIEDRLVEAAKVVDRYYQADQDKSEGQGAGQGQPRNSQEEKDRMAEAAERRGLNSRQTKEAMNAAAGSGSKEATQDEASELLEQARAMRIYQKVIKVVAKVKGKMGLSVEIPEVWKVGDSPERLDVTGSVTRFGKVIPGISALKTSEFQVEKPVWDEHGAKIALGIDESGSVNFEVWSREIEAAIGLVAYAMEKKMPCFALKFDSPNPGAGYVCFQNDFSFGYWTLMRWLVRRRLDGGTEITQVFEALLSVHNIAKSTVVILTDCGINKLNNAKKSIMALASKGCSFRIFMIGQNGVTKDLQAAFEGQDVKFFAVPRVDANLTEEAIREVA